MAKTSSHRSLIAQRYATSLFESAKALKVIDVVGEQICDLHKLLKESSDFRELLFNPAIQPALQLEALTAILERVGLIASGEQGLFGRFLKLLSANGRLKILPDVMKLYQEMVHRLRKEVFAQVVAAKAISQEQHQAIQSLLEEVSKYRVHLDIKVDPSLLAGFVIRIGFYEINASLLNKLSLLKLTLKEVR